MLTLWDLIEPIAKRLRPKIAPPSAPAPSVGAAPGRVRVTPASATRSRKPKYTSLTVEAGSKPDSMLARYDRMVQTMLARHNVRVRKWRSSSSGCAWQVLYRDGTVVNLIESPRPRGPLSAAIFLHEIGHHAIGLDVYKPRCLEEYHAWMFSLAAMKEHDLNITDAVHNRVRRSLKYAVGKAKRRGIKSLPPELHEFV